MDENYRHRLSPEQAIQHWVGWPEDPRCGAIPADATPQQAVSKQALWDQLNPDGPPIGEGPWIQDDELPDGTPADRSRGWSTPSSITPPTYADDTSTPVHYLPIIKAGDLIAYIWASPTEHAANYLPITNAGEQARIAAGLWHLRLSDFYAAGTPPLDALRQCRNYPHDFLSGEIPDNAHELIASTLDGLKVFANRQAEKDSASDEDVDGQFTRLTPPPPIPMADDYSRWTRRPVVYLPVLTGTQLIGYLWAGVGSNAAGYMRRVSVDPDNIIRPDFWHKRLTTNYRQGHTAEQAIQSWIGVAADPRCGGIPAGAVLQQAPSEQALWDQLNPDGPPIGAGPWVQDDEFPSGTPIDRSKGWGPLHSVALPGYAKDTTTPVNFIPISKNGGVVAVLWASPTEPAADYLPFRYAGKDGIVGRGRWVARLSDSFTAGRHPVDAIHYCRSFPYDEYSGWIEPDAPEGVAPSLEELRKVAEEY